MSREKFEELKRSGELKADALFPYLNYEFCKNVWENSPLIASLCDVAIKTEEEAKKK